MCFVDDQRVVSLQQAIALDFGQQNAVGHELHVRAWAGPLFETDLVAHLLAELTAKLAGHAGRDAGCSNPPRLRDANLALGAPSHLQQHLRQLSGLTRTGCPGHDHHLMPFDRRHDVGDAGGYRQLRRKTDRRSTRSGRGRRSRAGHRGPDLAFSELSGRRRRSRSTRMARPGVRRAQIALNGWKSCPESGSGCTLSAALVPVSRGFWLSELGALFGARARSRAANASARGLSFRPSRSKANSCARRRTLFNHGNAGLIALDVRRGAALSELDLGVLHAPAARRSLTGVPTARVAQPWRDRAWPAARFP